jgi:hypothetical protein
LCTHNEPYYPSGVTPLLRWSWTYRAGTHSGVPARYFLMRGPDTFGWVSCGLRRGPMPRAVRRAHGDLGGGGCSGDEHPPSGVAGGGSRMSSSVLVGEPVVCNLDGVAADMACRADFWYLIGGLGPLLNVMYFPKYSMLIAVIVRASQGCRPGFLFHCHSRSLLYEDCYRASVCTIHPTSRKRDSRKSEYQRLPKRSLICVIRSLDSASNLRTLHVAVGHHMKGQDS